MLDVSTGLTKLSKPLSGGCGSEKPAEGAARGKRFARTRSSTGAQPPAGATPRGGEKKGTIPAFVGMTRPSGGKKKMGGARPRRIRVVLAFYLLELGGDI